MSGWNKPTERPVETKKAAKPAFKHVLIASGVVAVLGCVLLLVFSGGDGAPKAKTVKKQKAIKEIGVAEAEDVAHAEKLRKIRGELNEKVKDFIKKAPTNRIELAQLGRDPNDPDNILRTQFAKDVDILLRIKPGERIPKQLFFGFMIDDVAMSQARASGEAVVEMDGGNEVFLDSIKKWKVAIKETDGADQISRKQRLVDAQIDLLKGMDEGLTVNDSIRAAYQYRIRAAEARDEMIKMITELHGQEGSKDEDTIQLIKHANEKLRADGIKEIYPDEVIDGYEESEADESNIEAQE